MRSLKQALEEFDRRLAAKQAEKHAVQQQLEEFQQRMLEIQVKIGSIAADRERVMEISGRYGAGDEKMGTGVQSGIRLGAQSGVLPPAQSVTQSGTPPVQRPFKEIQKEVQPPSFVPQKSDSLDSALFKNATPAMRQVGNAGSGAVNSTPGGLQQKSEARGKMNLPGDSIDQIDQIAQSNKSAKPAPKVEVGEKAENKEKAGAQAESHKDRHKDKDDESEVADIMPASRRLRQATAAGKAKEEAITPAAGSISPTPLGTPPFKINRQAGLPVPVDEPLPAALKVRKPTSNMDAKPVLSEPEAQAESPGEGRKRPGRADIDKSSDKPKPAPAQPAQSVSPTQAASPAAPVQSTQSIGTVPLDKSVTGEGKATSGSSSENGAASGGTSQELNTQELSTQELDTGEGLIKEKPVKAVAAKKDALPESQSNQSGQKPGKEEADTVKKVNDALRSLFR